MSFNVYRLDTQVVGLHSHSFSKVSSVWSACRCREEKSSSSQETEVSASLSYPSMDLFLLLLLEPCLARRLGQQVHGTSNTGKARATVPFAIHGSNLFAELYCLVCHHSFPIFGRARSSGTERATRGCRDVAGAWMLAPPRLARWLCQQVYDTMYTGVPTQEEAPGEPNKKI